ncbi:hypothetical protein [Virgibacillus indicus]|nr:hypothetical protein [Virgibacillus indicus]
MFFYITIIVGFSLIYYGYVKKRDYDLKEKELKLEERKVELEMKKIEYGKDFQEENKRES